MVLIFTKMTNGQNAILDLRTQFNFQSGTDRSFDGYHPVISNIMVKNDDHLGTG